MSAEPAAAGALASVGARIGAWLIDELLLLGIFVVGLLGAMAVSETDLAAAAVIVLGVGAWFWLPVWWASGRGPESPGKRTLGITVVGTDGAPIGIGRSILRRFVLILGQVLLYGGWLVGLRDPQRRTWHDQAAHSLVVRRHAMPEQPTPTAADAALPPSKTCPVCGFALGTDGRCTVCDAKA